MELLNHISPNFDILCVTDEQIRGKIIGTTLGYIQYCSFSPDDKLVAACRDTDVIILQSNVSTSIM